MTNEEFKEAIELVQRHQDWRRGAETEMENPKELGVSIDTVLKSARELSQLKDGTHPDMVLVPRAYLDLRYEQGRSDELFKLALAAALRGKQNDTVSKRDIR